MKNLTLSTLLAGAAMLGASAAHAAPSAEEFTKKATISNLFEIQTSQLAVERAQSPEIKEFAQQMIKDHEQAGVAMRKAVGEAKLTGAVPTKLDDSHQDKLTDLRETAPKDFDKAYIKAQADAHDDATDLFEDYAKNGDNAPLKEFAATTLPKLEQHEDHAERIEDKF